MAFDELSMKRAMISVEKSHALKGIQCEDTKSFVEKQIKDIETKAINVWTSLNNAGTGGNSWMSTNTSDWALMSSYVNNDVVYTCTSMNANAVACSPLHLYRETSNTSTKKTRAFKSKKLNFKQKKKIHSKSLSDDSTVEEILDHPVLEILKHTCEDLNGSQILFMTQVSLELFGRAYWLLDKSPSGEIEGIRILKSYYVYPLRDGEGNVIGYSYLGIIDGKGGSVGTIANSIFLTVEDVIPFRYASVSDPYAGGISWLRSCFNKVGLSTKFAEYQNWLLDNRARPDIVLTQDINASVSREDLERLEKNFNDRNGRQNNGGSKAMPPGVKVIPLTYTPVDLAPLEIDAAMVKAVSNAASIPYALLTNDSNYANMNASLELWARQGIYPRIALLTLILNSSFLPQFEDTENMFFEFDNPIPEDEEFELQQDTLSVTKAQVLVASGYGTPNEVRELLGLPPSDESAYEEVMDDGINAPAKPEPLSVPDPEVAEEKKFDLDVILKINSQVHEGKLDQAVAINLVAKTFGIEQSEAKQYIIKSKKKLAAPNHPEPDPRFVHQLTDAYKNLEAELTLQLHGFKDADGKLPDEFKSKAEWTQALEASLTPLVAATITKSGNARISDYKSVGATTAVNHISNASEAAKKLTLDFCDSTMQTTMKEANNALEQTRQSIAEGMDKGEAMNQIRDRIKGIFEKMDNTKALEIARTETIRASCMGQKMAASQSGVVKGFKWLASADACDECQEYGEVGIDEAFKEGEGYDNITQPPAHPNCRCAMLEVLKPIKEE